MDRPPDPGTAAVLAAFLDRFLADQASGSTATLETYQQLFPGYETAVAGEYRALTEAADDDPPTASEPPASRSLTERREAVGHYRLIREIGRGGQGEVYLAEDARLSRQVALKILRGAAFATEHGLRRFRREAELAARLDHPNIATVYETGTDDGVAYLAMRYVEGETLAARIGVGRESTTEDGLVAPSPDNAPSPCVGPASRAALDDMLTFFERVARAVHEAHELGIIHRDLKPGNIMVTPAGEPIVLDFGLARDVEGDDPVLTATGDFFGTPHYMSPEQLIGSRLPLDRRTDVYSLAITLYEALTCRRPFEAPTRDRVYQSVLTKPHPNPRRLNPSVPRELCIVLETALEKDRDKRYDTALDFAEELVRVRERRPIHARPAGVVRRATRWIAREPAKAAAAGLTLVLAGVLGYGAAAWPGIRRDRAIAQTVLKEQRLELHLQRGYLLLHEDRPVAAKDAFEAALAEFPADPDAINGLSLALFRQSKSAEALARIDALPSDAIGAPAMRRLRAAFLRLNDRDEEAEALLEGLGNTTDAQTLFARGAHALAEGHQDEDRAAFERALDLMSRCNVLSERRRLLYLCGLAHALVHVPRPTLTRDVISALESEAARGRGDDYTRYWIALAESALDPDAALARLERMLADGDGLAAAHHLRGRLLLTRGNAEAAIGSFERALELAPDYAAAMSNLGAAYERVKRYEESRRLFGRLVAKNPKDATYLNNLAVAQRRLKDNEVALSTYRRVLALKPNDVQAWVGVAQLSYLLGRAGDAREAAEKAIELDSGAGGAHRVLADLAARSDPKTAIERYRDAVERSPDDWRSLVKLANALVDAKRAEEAVPFASRAVKAGSDQAVTHQCLGRTLDAVGRFAPAVRAHARSVELDPGNAANHYNLGTARIQTRDFRGAIAALKAAIDRRPDYAQAHCNLGHAHFYVADYPAARAAYREGHRLGQTQPGWRYPSAEWIRNAEKMMELEGRLDAVLAGEVEQPSAPDLLTLAGIAQRNGRYADQAQLALDAFEADPVLTSDPAEGRRYNAACAAALAMLGRGRLPPGFDEAARGRWRDQAIEWLEQDLQGWKNAFEAKRLKRDAFRAWLGRYRSASPLRPLRDPRLLADLPEATRTRCEQLWAGFRELAQRITDG